MVTYDARLGGWTVTDAAASQDVLRDPATWSSDHFDGPRPVEQARWIAELTAAEPALGELLAVAPHTLVGVDAPDHIRLRAILRRAFAPAAIDRLRPVVVAEAVAALEAIVDGEPVDVVAAFTRPVPFRVIASVLGLERTDWPELERLAHAASTDDTAAEDRDALRDRLHAELALLRFFSQRLAGPGSAAEDARCLPALRAAVVAGEITPREAAGLCREVLVAGADSVGHHLAGALEQLAGDPAQAAWLRAKAAVRGPAALAAFVEERLAKDPPFTGFWRRATRPTLLAGTAVPQDGLVLIRYAAVNATTARHLSFGHGVHFCLGAALARLEATEALSTVLAATSAITQAGPAERLTSAQVSGLRTLPLRLAP